MHLNDRNIAALLLSAESVRLTHRERVDVLEVEDALEAGGVTVLPPHLRDTADAMRTMAARVFSLPARETPEPLAVAWESDVVDGVRVRAAMDRAVPSGAPLEERIEALVAEVLELRANAAALLRADLGEADIVEHFIDPAELARAEETQETAEIYETYSPPFRPTPEEVASCAVLAEVAGKTEREAVLELGRRVNRARSLLLLSPLAKEEDVWGEDLSVDIDAFLR